VSDFDFALRHTLEAEGVFSDHPDDPGGATKYGITEVLADRYGFRVRDLEKPDAKAIYRSEFWEPLRIGSVESKHIAAELFDTAANMGPHAAVEIAQKACQLLGEQIAVDGRMGPQTLGALNALIPRYERHLYAAMNGFQFVRYVTLFEADPKRRRTFIKGWMLRLARFDGAFR